MATNKTTLWQFINNSVQLISQSWNNLSNGGCKFALGHMYFDMHFQGGCRADWIPHWLLELFQWWNWCHQSNNQHQSVFECTTSNVFQYLIMGAKTWIAPNGQRHLLPKSERDGYMSSTFTSREFGFRQQKSEIMLERINSKRRATGSNYIDTQAPAMEINGTL